MTRDEWNNLVHQARAIPLLEVLHAHDSVDLRRQGRELVGGCPICQAGDDRFSINLARELFYCRQCDTGGCGSIDLEIFLGGGEFVDAVKRLTGISEISGHAKRSLEELAAARAESTRRKREAAKGRAEQHRKAAWLWSQQQPTTGSLVETYLRARGYIGMIPPTIGYLPAHGEYPPAMISAFALPNEIAPGELGAPLKVEAVHLTKLLPDGSDRIRSKDGKITVGSPRGLPIAVSSITDGLSLVITEGVEDALAYTAAGYAAWAAGSAPFISTLEISVPDYITTVIIERHPDDKARGYVAQFVELLRKREVRTAERPIEIIIRDAKP